MLARGIYLLLLFTVLGFGAGVRYVFFLMLGRKKNYKELIEPASQDKWNILVALVLVIPIVLGIVKYGTNLKDISNTRYLKDIL